MKSIITSIIIFLCLLLQNSRAQKIEMTDADGKLTFHTANKELLSYQYTTVYPPPGQDTSYKRSGFIHPLKTLNGQALTRIQPPDHYHHYGVWNPWTHTLFENDTVDFWNLNKKQGTVRFVKLVSKNTGPGFAEFTSLHEHVVFKKDGTEKPALNEWQTIRVYAPDDANKNYVVDITSKLSCASESPFLLLTYRYGGLGWRAAASWNKNNCEIFTSEGNTRNNTDSTRARWITAQGTLPGNDFGGMIIMSHPDNYNHPEPLRIWDESGNKGNGDVFINFSPTKNRDWLLEPGKTYTLKYRFVVFNGKMTATGAENLWRQLLNH